MKTLMRMSWAGFIGFLLCMVISLWNVNSNPGLAGIFIGLALPCVCLFFGGMMGAHYHIEETDGERAARCIHTARWYNREMVDTIKATDEILERASTLSQLLTEKGYDCHMAARFADQHDKSTMDSLRLEFATTASIIQEASNRAHYLLRELAAHESKAKRLLISTNQAEVKIRAAHAASGGRTWIGGPPIAGQMILASEVEPQRILVITNQVYKTSVPGIEEAIKELAYAEQMAPQGLRRLSDFLTKR